MSSESEYSSIQNKLRELTNLGRFDQVNTFLGTLSSEALGARGVALALANLRWRQGDYKAAEQACSLVLGDRAMALLPDDSMTTVALLLQLALIRCETRGALIDAKLLCEQVKDNLLSNAPELDQLAPPVVWVELLYHEIIMFQIHEGEEWDKSAEASAAQRLGQVHKLILDNTHRYQEAFDLLRILVFLLPSEECVYVVSHFMTTVREDWALGLGYHIRAKLAFKVGAYETAEQELHSAIPHLHACGNKVGITDCGLLIACIPSKDSPLEPKAFDPLTMNYRRLLYPFGLFSCLRAQANHALDQREFQSHHKAFTELLASRDEFGSLFGWCHDQLSMLLGSNLEGAHFGARHENWLALLEKLGNADFQVPAFVDRCYTSFALFLLDVSVSSEAVQKAQSAIEAHIGEEVGPSSSDARLALAIVKEHFQDMPDHKYQAAFDEIRTQLEAWAENDDKRHMHQQRFEKLLILASFHSKLAHRVGTDIAYAKALEWLDEAHKIVPLLPGDKQELAYAEIAFKRGHLCELFADVNEAFSLFLDAREHFINAGTPQISWVHRAIGCNRLLVFNIERSSHRLTVGRGVTLLNEACGSFYAELDILETQRALSKLAVCHANLARVWQSAFEIGQEDALDKALEHVKMAEQIRDEIRYEFSVLKGPANMPWKHSLVNKGQDVISLGLELYHAKGDAEGMWSWVQKAKARSLLDVMGTDAVDPSSLKNDVSHLPEVTELLEKERVLTEAIQETSTSERYALRRQLAQIRSTMQDIPELQTLLTLRGARVIDPTSLTKVFKGMDDITFVDWAYFEEKIILVVARPNAQFKMWDIALTPSGVATWKQNNLRFLKDDTECLRDLDALTAPLEEFTKCDDLLILSPTGPLHGIPLHALLVGDKVLIDRNRVIYSANLSILQLCMERHSRPTQEACNPSWHAAIFGNPTNDRLHGAESAKYLAHLFNCKANIGPDANSVCFRDSVPSAKLIHYHGHARFDNDEPLRSSLILAGKVQFTAGEIFTLHLVASLVTLIACSSGAQQISPGDEPEGLIPAFLFAGADAVIGSLWPVKDVHGKEFSEALYEGFTKGGTIDLAAAVREAILKIKERHPEPHYWASFILHGNWILKDMPVLSLQDS